MNRKPDLLSDLKQVAEICNTDDPSRQQYETHGNYHYKSLTFHFNTFTEAKVQANLDPHSRLSLPKSDYIDDIIHVAEKLNETPTIEQYQEYGQYSPSTIIRKFTKWNRAIEEAGLSVRKRHTIPESELIEDLTAVIETHGPNISQAQYDRVGTYHHQTIKRRLGGWDKALQIASE